MGGSIGGAGTGGGRAWGADGQGWVMFIREDQHWAGNRQRREMNDGQPGNRERVGETWRGSHYIVALTDGNGATQKKRRHARGKCSQVNGVPKETNKGGGIHIATLNIRSGRSGGLETALRALRQGNIRIRVLQETKLTRGIHI